MIEYFIASLLVCGPSALWALYFYAPGGPLRYASSGIAFVATQVSVVVVALAMRSKK